MWLSGCPVQGLDLDSNILMGSFQLSIFHDSWFYEMYMKWKKVVIKVGNKQLTMQYIDNKLTKEPCVFSSSVFNIQSISMHLFNQKT